MKRKTDRAEVNAETWLPEASHFGNLLGANGIKYAIFGAGALAVQNVMIRPTIDIDFILQKESIIMKKNKLSFAIRAEDNGFSAQCIEFSGIITQADTESKLREMIDDAVSGYLEAFPEEKDRLEKIKKGKIIEITI